MELFEKVGKYINTKEFVKTKDFGAINEGSARGKQKKEAPTGG